VMTHSPQDTPEPSLTVGLVPPVRFAGNCVLE
jgi:hypothetical protein